MWTGPDVIRFPDRANATIFHQRWGWWPMRDWLDSFEQQGLIARDSERGVCVVAAEN